MAVYLRDLADRCDRIARRANDPSVQEAIAAVGVELAEKAVALDMSHETSTDKK
ncbi:MAG TPA: hypothetical protein VE224_15950 [Pseudolabrys sp.]|nr:hypothetical protein [Pseudolabrys sp.]